MMTHRWSCAVCGHKGEVDLSGYLRPKETDSEASARHQRETRQECVSGCEYRVTGRLELKKR